MMVNVSEAMVSTFQFRLGRFYRLFLDHRRAPVNRASASIYASFHAIFHRLASLAQHAIVAGENSIT
jgi:hypothetical protein